MKKPPIVGIIMGSQSDLPVMQAAADTLSEFGVAFEMTIVSAHRTPDRLVSYSRSAEKRGLKVIIAGAGGAAHLPGMTASMTVLPVIGVPILTTRRLDHSDSSPGGIEYSRKGRPPRITAPSFLLGLDSLLSIVQMPPGVPVATMAIDGARNAALFALKILAVSDSGIRNKLFTFQKKMSAEVKKKSIK